MKLIIDIPEKDYEEIMVDKKHQPRILSWSDRLISNGIPLDKIRTELHATAEMHEDENYYLREEWIDEIIDKYKAESEE